MLKVPNENKAYHNVNKELSCKTLTSSNSRLISVLPKVKNVPRKIDIK